MNSNDFTSTLQILFSRRALPGFVLGLATPFLIEIIDQAIDIMYPDIRKYYTRFYIGICVFSIIAAFMVPLQLMSSKRTRNVFIFLLASAVASLTAGILATFKIKTPGFTIYFLFTMVSGVTYFFWLTISFRKLFHARLSLRTTTLSILSGILAGLIILTGLQAIYFYQSHILWGIVLMNILLVWIFAPIWRIDSS